MAQIFRSSRTTCASAIATFGMLHAAASQAEPGTLADSPLFLTNPVDPNVLFVLDDSGSMDWGLMTPEASGIMDLGCDYYYTHPAATNRDYWTVPTEQALLAAGIAPPYGGVWRAWSSDYNRVYYDPTVTYAPWPGENSLGTAYGNVPATAVPLDPYVPGTGTVDLTAVASYSTDFCAGGLGSVTVSGFNPASYYRWVDSDADGRVDAGDAHVFVEIAPATPLYTGGPERADCIAAPVCTYAEEIQNFANWFSYYRTRALTAKAAYGQVIAGGSNARMGLTTLHNNGATNTQIADMNQDPGAGAKGALLGSLYSMYGSGGTPLRSSFDNSARYLACDSNSYFGSCPALPASLGGQCQQNVALLMTDGFYNGSFFASYGNADGDNDSPWDSGPDGPYGDSSTGTLADIAMEFYENDIHPTLANELNPPSGSIDENTAQHVVTYSVAFGVQGTVADMPPNATDPFAWPAPTTDAAKIDDLRHAAFNGRGNFYSAQNPSELISGLRGALRSIQGRVGSAASVAFNTGSLSTNSEVYLALFNSERWSGDLLSFPLDPLSGDIDSAARWSAGEELTSRNLDSNPRTLLTYDGTDGIPFAWSSLTTAQKNDFRTSPAGTLDNEATGMARHAYIRGDRGCEISSTGTCSYSDGTDIFDTKEFRERDSRLGDIIHSGPVFVGAPESNWPDVAPFPGTAGQTYTEFREDNASRPGVVYVGANDGMLHAFSQATGEELVAYVPNELFSTSASDGLHHLADPAYTHRYQVDLTPSVSDVYARTRTGGVVDWKTVLVGGLRGGGRGLFALDVTDPTAFSESGSAPANTVMWEFTSSDDIDLGHSFSRASIVPLQGSSGSIRWGVVVGNGYNDTGSGAAKLFILLLEGGLDGTWTAGTDYIEISTQVGTTTDRNGLSTPAVVDTDGDGLADRAYAGDLFGNLWAFDLSGANTGNWDVAYKSGSTPEPLFTAPAGQQITSTPVIVRNKSVPTAAGNAPNALVLFGTGQYLTSADVTSTDVQSMYGVWDSGDSQLDRANLVQQFIGTGLTSEGVPGRTLTDAAVPYASMHGWFMDLPDTGERIIADPVIRGDLVFFSTMRPDPDPCSFGGSGWLMVAKWLNGGHPDEVSFDLNRDAELTDLDAIGGEAAAGMAIVGIPTSPVNLGNKRYVSTTETTGGDAIETTELIDIGGPRTGRLSWEELTP